MFWNIIPVLCIFFVHFVEKNRKIHIDIFLYSLPAPFSHGIRSPPALHPGRNESFLSVFQKAVIFSGSNFQRFLNYDKKGGVSGKFPSPVSGTERFRNNKKAPGYMS